MNFALSAIVIIIFLLPGSTLLKAYYSSFKEKQSSIEVPLNELLLRGLFFSIIIHSAAFCVLGLFDWAPRLDLLYRLLQGRELPIPDEDLTTYFLHFSLYTLILILIVWFATKLVKKFFQQRNWDIKINAFRNTNYWFHVFSARYLEVDNRMGKQVDTDLIMLDILCQNEVIYSGFLLDFNYSPHKDELENIILFSVRKRTFIKADGKEVGEKAATGIPVKIPGDVFLVFSKDIININIYYLSVTIEQSSTYNNPPKALLEESKL